MTARGRLAAGLAAATMAGGALLAHAILGPPPAPSPERLRELRQRRDAVGERLGELAGRSPRLQVPAGLWRPGGAVLGIPVALAERVGGGAMDALLADLRLELAGIEVEVEKKLRVATPLGRVTAGRYRLGLRIVELDARLSGRREQLRFGDDRVELGVTVRLAAARGRALAGFHWDGSGIGGVVCGDFDAGAELAGKAAPLETAIAGSVRFAVEDGRLVAIPEVPDAELEVCIEPDAASWAALERILAERRGLCGFVLDRVDVAAAVRQALAKGIRVRLPGHLLEPVVLPIGFSKAVEVGGREATIALVPAGVAVTAESIWLAAQIQVGSGAGAPLTQP